MSRTARRRTRRAWKTRAPAYALAVLAALVLFTVYRNAIHRTLFWQSPYVFSYRGEVVSLDVTGPAPSIHAERAGLYHAVKLTVPFAHAPDGCEFLHAAAVYEYAPLSARELREPLLLEFARARYLVRFQYDLKNGRCEAKDLFLYTGRYPTAATIQLVAVELHADRVVERPLATGVRLAIGGDRDAPVFTAAAVAVPAAEPFRTRVETRRAPAFSTDLDPGDVELIVAPYQSLRDRLVAEIDRRTATCRATTRCDPIVGAVASILDPDLLDALERARAAGVRVDVTVNELAHLVRNPYRRDLPLRRYPASPWMWLRGNPIFAETGFLPMHTKFLVFGDDLVISSNANYEFHAYPHSRELAAVYRRRDVAAIYQEVATFTRTLLYYPVAVDLRDRFVLLFNADRPRGYAASSAKPYLAIRTDEGRTASAYGILFELMARWPGALTLSMSPLSDSCAVYRRRRCLFGVLRDLAAAGRVERVTLNAFFYTSVGARAAPQVPAMQALREVFAGAPGALRLQTEVGRSASAHHARGGLFGDVVLLGSANYARPSTLNTIELIRDPAVAAELRAELATFDEPYFIAPAHPLSRADHVRDGCEVVVERQLLAPVAPAPPLKRFRRDALVAELARRAGRPVDPSWLAIELPEGRHAHDGTPPRWIERELPPVATSASSYFCLRDRGSGATFVVRGAAAP